MIDELADHPDLAACLKVLGEAERLKLVERQSYVSCFPGLRAENAAEHSWHAALAALLLADTADEPIDLGRVIQMLLIHDLVEIDTGDTFIFDEVGQAERVENEAAAAQRIFGQLPEPMGHRMLELWYEFEARQTPEARFAKSIDRLLPQMMHLTTGGQTWQNHGITEEQVEKIKRTICAGSTQLGELSQSIVATAVAAGYIHPAKPTRYTKDRPEPITSRA